MYHVSFLFTPKLSDLVVIITEESDGKTKFRDSNKGENRFLQICHYRVFVRAAVKNGFHFIYAILILFIAKLNCITEINSASIFPHFCRNPQFLFSLEISALFLTSGKKSASNFFFVKKTTIFRKQNGD